MQRLKVRSNMKIILTFLFCLFVVPIVAFFGMLGFGDILISDAGQRRLFLELSFAKFGRAWKALKPAKATLFINLVSKCRCAAHRSWGYCECLAGHCECAF